MRRRPRRERRFRGFFSASACRPFRRCIVAVSAGVRVPAPLLRARSSVRRHLEKQAMKGSRGLLVLVVLAGAALPAPAGWIFNRKTTKPDPSARVPELIQILKTDGDESKRAAAAEELRQFDPNQFPGIVPALTEALMQDAKSSVRAEAAQSLGKLRPVN